MLKDGKLLGLVEFGQVKLKSRETHQNMKLNYFGLFFFLFSSSVFFVSFFYNCMVLVSSETIWFFKEMSISVSVRQF